MIHETAPQPFDHAPRSMAHRLGAILWPSFFAACVATMVCFALVDPLTLRDITFPGLEISRETGYAIGFFAFWAPRPHRACSPGSCCDPPAASTAR